MGSITAAGVFKWSFGVRMQWYHYALQQSQMREATYACARNHLMSVYAACVAGMRERVGLRTCDDVITLYEIASFLYDNLTLYSVSLTRETRYILYW